MQPIWTKWFLSLNWPFQIYSEIRQMTNSKYPAARVYAFLYHSFCLFYSGTSFTRNRMGVRRFGWLDRSNNKSLLNLPFSIVSTLAWQLMFIKLDLYSFLCCRIQIDVSDRKVVWQMILVSRSFYNTDKLFLCYLIEAKVSDMSFWFSSMNHEQFI